MAWKYQIHYVPGRKIPVPDATSRSPDARVDSDSLDEPDWPNTSVALAAIRLAHEGMIWSLV